MRLKKLFIAVASGCALAAIGAGYSIPQQTSAQEAGAEADWGKYQVGDKRTGYTFAQPETREMQDDDFMNPGFLLADDAKALWEEVDGEAGQSCAGCHDDVSSLKGVGATYPVYDEDLGKMVSVEHRINQCRTEQMQAEPWKWESDELLGMTVLVKQQSRDMPVNVSIDGPAAEFYEKGKEFYFTRRGQLDMACAHCHLDNSGEMLRANLLSQGQANGFPTYRLKWQKVGSLHRRIRGCNRQVRADPYDAGSEEYTNLELFLMHRANDLPVETPAVRN